LFEEGLAATRRLDIPVTINVALYNLARLAIIRADYRAASRLLEEGVRLSGRTKDRANLAHFLEAMSAVAASRGEAERSAVLIGMAEGSLEEAGAPVYSFYATDPSAQARVVDEARTALGDAAFEQARERGRDMNLDEAVAYALS
jgi:non-specific serine/threonine protein kinase